MTMQLDTIVCGDALEVMAALPDSSVNLIVSDWPYYKVKPLAWDRQWKTVEDYLDWIGQVCAEYRRILAPNGSLYAFASPKIAARVELRIGETFEVLNHITWSKPKIRFPHSQLMPKEDWRRYNHWSEIVIFAEHYGADSAAKGESGYGAKCDELRGFVFEPLRAYLDGERRRAEIDKIAINVACGFSPTPGGMASRHYFSQSQWQLPTAEHYQAMQQLFNQQGRCPALPYEDYHDAPRSRFERDHSEPEYLRADYEDLRADYEDLRRPFNLTAQDQYTDVWDFPTVKAYPGKHPCEKPPEMWKHIIKVSSRPGDVVGDFFIGSGGSLAMAMGMDRRYLGCDISPHWAQKANERVEKARLEMSQLELAF